MSTSTMPIGDFGNWVKQNTVSKELKRKAINALKRKRELLEIQQKIEEIEDMMQKLDGCYSNKNIKEVNIKEVNIKEQNNLYNQSLNSKNEGIKVNDFKFDSTQIKEKFEIESEYIEERFGMRIISNAA
jgi:Na+/phosphate symporter